jgi:hypothetical protein
VLLSDADNVANHPQTLWITLWTGSRGHRQVTLPKGFSFVRSIFERIAFSVLDQWVIKSSPSGARVAAQTRSASPSAPGGGG